MQSGRKDVLTDRDIAVLFFIRDYLEAEGTTPGEPEIADFFDMSPWGVREVIIRLEARGEIERTDRALALKKHRITVRNEQLYSKRQN